MRSPRADQPDSSRFPANPPRSGSHPGRGTGHPRPSRIQGVGKYAKLARDFHSYFAGGGPRLAYLESEDDPWLYPLGRDYFLDREPLFYPLKDERGDPFVSYDPADDSPRYRPGRVSSYGLASWNRGRQGGGARYRDGFLTCANWFMRFEDGRFNYDIDFLDMKAPWISGLGQGEGMSVLVRAYVLTGEERFLRQAQEAFLPMTRPVDEGGVRTTLHDGSFFIEEYPQRDPVHVLNGFLSAVFGVADLHRVRPTDQTGAVLEACWDTLARNIGCWDLDGWSAYDLHNLGGPGPRNYCTATYQSAHVALLRHAHRRSRRQVLGDVAERWQAGLDSLPTRLRGMAGKVRYRLRHPNELKVY